MRWRNSRCSIRAVFHLFGRCRILSKCGSRHAGVDRYVHLKCRLECHYKNLSKHLKMLRFSQREILENAEILQCEMLENSEVFATWNAWKCWGFCNVKCLKMLRFSQREMLGNAEIFATWNAWKCWDFRYFALWTLENGHLITINCFTCLYKGETYDCSGGNDGDCSDSTIECDDCTVNCNSEDGYVLIFSH